MTQQAMALHVAASSVPDLSFRRMSPQRIAADVVRRLRGVKSIEERMRIFLARFEEERRRVKAQLIREAEEDATILLWLDGIGTRLPTSLRCRAEEMNLHPPDSATEEWRAYICRHNKLLTTAAFLGRRDAKETLCNYATMLLAEGQQLPPWLQEVVVWVAQEAVRPSTHGRRRNTTRDFAIADAVGYIEQKVGCRRTRSRASKQDNLFELLGDPAILWFAGCARARVREELQRGSQHD
jgi:hypothetical protein